MTTFAPAAQPSFVAGPLSPSLPRLVGGGLVAMMGVVILSIAGAILVIAALLHGTAAVAAGSGPVEG
jgi:hypothetical protein